MSTPIESTESTGRPALPSQGAEGSAETSTDALAAAAAGFASGFERWANRKAAEAGLGAQRLRLLNMVHCRGPQKMADLADALAVTPRNVTALVDGLEADGLIRRTPHSTDRRVTLVELACSSDSVESQFRAFQESMGSLFAGLDEDDRRTLLRLLTILHDRMHADTAKSTETGRAADA
jgi:DNA-binding MarR family transcriptional regulator